MNSSGTGTTDGKAAVYMSGSAIIKAGNVDTTSGDAGVERTNSSTKIENPSGATVSAQTASPSPDPFESLPTPNTSNGVVTSNSHTNASYSSNVTLNPGIYYNGINITNSPTVTLNPGIYVLAGQGSGKNGQGGLSVSGGATVNGSGVVFYNTGSDYTSSGSPDSADNSPPDPFNHTPLSDSSATFGGITISNGATFNVSPPTSGPFQGMLIYQRRANTNEIDFTGGAAGSSGTIYAKWADVNFNNGASGTFNGQIIANTLTLTGNPTVNLNYSSGSAIGQALKVYLVD